MKQRDYSQTPRRIFGGNKRGPQGLAGNKRRKVGVKWDSETKRAGTRGKYRKS